jgi:hypothetical protein
VLRALILLHTPRTSRSTPQLEKRIEHNVSVARELVVASKKERALLALKKKKMNEHQLQQITAYLLNVEDLVGLGGAPSGEGGGRQGFRRPRDRTRISPAAAPAAAPA